MAEPSQSEAPDDATVLSPRQPVQAEDLDDSTVVVAASLKAQAARTPQPQTETDRAIFRPRAAHVPDAAALRTPVAPRALPDITVTRAPDAAPPRAIAPTEATPDHVGTERTGRARSRRRAVVVGVSVLAVVAGSAAALVLLLLT